MSINVGYPRNFPRNASQYLFETIFVFSFHKLHDISNIIAVHI